VCRKRLGNEWAVPHLPTRFLGGSKGDAPRQVTDVPPTRLPEANQESPGENHRRQSRRRPVVTAMHDQWKPNRDVNVKRRTTLLTLFVWPSVNMEEEAGLTTCTATGHQGAMERKESVEL